MTLIEGVCLSGDETGFLQDSNFREALKKTNFLTAPTMAIMRFSWRLGKLLHRRNPEVPGRMGAIK